MFRARLSLALACCATLTWTTVARAQTAPPAAPPPPKPGSEAAIEEQIAALRAEQEAALAKLKAEQAAELAKVEAEEASALEALAAKQAELDRRLAALHDEEAARAKTAEDEAKVKENQPAPGVALSALGVPVRLFGSFALRYDYSVNSNLTDTLTNGIQANWLLTRIRFGAEFGDKGPVIGGIRLSSLSQSPTVPYVPLSNAFRAASFGVDQAWAALRPLHDRDRLRFEIGRLPNPFWRGSIGTVHTQMIWDDDVNPAGAAATVQLYKDKKDPFVVENTLAYMQIQSVLDQRFIGLTGVVTGVGDQLRVFTKYLDGAVTYYEWWNLNTGLSVPTSQVGQGYVSPQRPSSAFLLGSGLQATNTIENYGPSGGAASGFLDSSFQILNPTAQVHIPFHKPALGDPDAYAILDYAHNFLPNHVLTGGNLATPNPTTCKSCTQVAGSGGNQNAPQLVDAIGITLGARLGDKTYERAFHPLNVWVTYRYVESDATLATFSDSDLGAGTGYEGWGMGTNYRLFRNFLAQVQYFDFMGYPVMENHVQRLFFDLIGDF